MKDLEVGKENSMKNRRNFKYHKHFRFTQMAFGYWRIFMDDEINNVKWKWRLNWKNFYSWCEWIFYIDEIEEATQLANKLEHLVLTDVSQFECAKTFKNHLNDIKTFAKLWQKLIHHYFRMTRVNE